MTDARSQMESKRMNVAHKLSVEKMVDHLFDTNRIVLRNYGSIDGVALLDNLSDMLPADL